MFACAAAEAVALVESVSDNARTEMCDARLLVRRLPLRDLVGIGPQVIDQKTRF